MKINIPIPCNEDWQKMTPTSNGAFCVKCGHDVIDFTKKSNYEDSVILRERNAEKLFGNFYWPT